MAELTGTGHGPYTLLPARAGEDLTGDEGLIVISNGTSKEIKLATATSERVSGILMTGGASGAEVAFAGAGSLVRAKAGGTVSAGVAQMFVTGAKITDASGNVNVMGVAQEDSVDDDLVLLLVQPGTIGSG
jgi:hypothetical protein